jgi:replication fork clamp-binding protein CrfC
VDDEEGRTPITWSSGFRVGPKAVPGTYTVRLTVGDTEKTQQLTILKDPYSEGTLADIREQVALRLRMQEEFNQLVDAVEKSEWIRAQLEDLLRSIEGDPAAEPVRERAEALEKMVIEIEHFFIDIHLTGGREDSFRNPMKLYGRYLELMSELNRTTDHPPTVQQRQVADLLRDRLLEAVDGLSQLMQTELAEFNAFLEQQNLSTTIR